MCVCVCVCAREGVCVCEFSFLFLMTELVFHFLSNKGEVQLFTKADLLVHLCSLRWG